LLNIVSLNGLFVWAIDLDDRKHTALNALIGDLNKFGQQNGVGTGWGTSNWTSATGNECSWTRMSRPAVRAKIFITFWLIPVQNVE